MPIIPLVNIMPSAPPTLYWYRAMIFSLHQSKVFFKELRQPINHSLLFGCPPAVKAGNRRQDFVNIRAYRFQRPVAERIVVNGGYFLVGGALLLLDDVYVVNAKRQHIPIVDGVLNGVGMKRQYIFPVFVRFSAKGLGSVAALLLLTSACESSSGGSQPGRGFRQCLCRGANGQRESDLYGYLRFISPVSVRDDPRSGIKKSGNIFTAESICGYKDPRLNCDSAGDLEF